METTQNHRKSDMLERFVERPPEVEAVQCPSGPLPVTIEVWRRLARDSRGVLGVEPSPHLLFKYADAPEQVALAGDWLVWRLDAPMPRPFSPPQVWSDEAFRRRFEVSLVTRNRRVLDDELAAAGDILPEPGGPVDAAAGDQPWCPEHGGYRCTHLPLRPEHETVEHAALIRYLAVLVAQCGRPEAGRLRRLLGFDPAADLYREEEAVAERLRARLAGVAP